MIPGVIAKGVSHDDTIQQIVQLLFMIIAMMVVLYIFSRIYWYNSNNGRDKQRLHVEFALSVGIAVLLFLLIGYLTGYFIIIYMPIYYTALCIVQYIEGEITESTNIFATERPIELLVAFAINIALYIPPMILGFFHGTKKRDRERAELTSHSSK
ncbi:hypothetical protein FACS1894219_11550 [Clostridia bacterium]|nr:hypothetical protein FACS1894219_11550 [Clostridia bacterium]